MLVVVVAMLDVGVLAMVVVVVVVLGVLAVVQFDVLFIKPAVMVGVVRVVGVVIVDTVVDFAVV